MANGGGERGYRMDLDLEEAEEEEDPIENEVAA